MSIPDDFIESKAPSGKTTPALIPKGKCGRTHVVSRHRRRGFLARYLLGALRLRLYRCTKCQKTFFAMK